MHNQDLRNEYFSKKNTYMIFHAILTVLRCIGLLLIVAIIIFVSLYSTISNGQTEGTGTKDSRLHERGNQNQGLSAYRS